LGGVFIPFRWVCPICLGVYVLVSKLFICDARVQIIDLMLLVVDITKGIQTQMAECLVIGEITCDRMIVVLNEIDLIELPKRASTIERVRFLIFYCYFWPFYCYFWLFYCYFKVLNI